MVNYVGMLKGYAKLMPHELGKYFPMTLSSWGLVYIQMGLGKSGAGVCVCGMRPRKMLSFMLCVHVTVLQIEIFADLVCANESVGKAYTGVQLSMHIRH
jgi:hypothetical protein